MATAQAAESHEAWPDIYDALLCPDNYDNLNACHKNYKI